MRRLVATLLILSLLLVNVAAPIRAEEASVTADCTTSALGCPTGFAATDLLGTLEHFGTPELIGPAPLISEPTIKVRKPITRTVTYNVTTKGTITADFEDFKAKVAETYADNRGWSRLGVSFKRVDSGGSFTVVLAEASQVPTFGYPCDSTYSCRAGRYVIINQDRWQGASDAWNKANGDLRNYRHMVVNHETGHWLGHPHQTCNVNSGNPAPVMQQQSIDLKGCKFNPWPLDSEIWSTTLGI